MSVLLYASEYLKLVDSRLFNCIQSFPAASDIYFHQKSTISAYVLEVIPMHSPYTQITFVSVFFLFPVVSFVFFDH